MLTEALLEPRTASRPGHHVIGLIGGAICEDGDYNDKGQVEHAAVRKKARGQ